MKNRILAIAAGVCVLGGCANTTLPDRGALESRKEVARLMQDDQARSIVRIEEGPYVKAIVEDQRAKKGDVSLNASNSPFWPLLSGIAKKYGYSTLMVEGIDSTKRVSIALDNVEPEHAMRTVAMLAGYVVVIDRSARTVTVADAATYTFRVPTSVLQKLDASFKVGGNPSTAGASASGGGGSGGQGGSSGGSSGSGQGASLTAEFTVSGKLGTNAPGLVTFLGKLAGKNAEVNVMPELGIISVRSNGQALKRVYDFLSGFSKDATTKVEIQASVVEVTLGDQFQYGIDWTKILRADGSRAISILGANAVTSPIVTSTITTDSIAAVINALKRVTDVRVVTQPTVLADNHVPTVLFDGVQIPYLGSLQSTVSGTSGTTTVTGTASYAVDGISLSLQPDVIGPDQVQISVVPVLSNVRNFSTFNLGSTGQLTVPTQTSKQSFMQVTVQSGKTVILGGNRYSTTSKDRAGVPGVNEIPVVGRVFGSTNDAESHRELVILLRANILPSIEIDPLVGESL